MPAKRPEAGRDGHGPPAPFLNCPRCGLTITPKARWLAIEHCPRCIARDHTAVRLFASSLPASQLYDANAAANRNATKRRHR